MSQCNIASVYDCCGIGAIELSIFSKLFATELDVVDIQTQRIEKFGKTFNSQYCYSLIIIVGESYSQRCLLIYDGIHYDPLVECDSNGNILQSVFPISNESVLHSALKIASEANKVS